MSFNNHDYQQKHWCQSFIIIIIIFWKFVRYFHLWMSPIWPENIGNLKCHQDLCYSPCLALDNLNQFAPMILHFILNNLSYILLSFSIHFLFLGTHISQYETHTWIECFSFVYSNYTLGLSWNLTQIFGLFTILFHANNIFLCLGTPGKNAT